MVIFQWPNKSLWTMLAASALSMVIKYGPIHIGLRAIFVAAGLFWCYGEILHGDSWFRRLLGVAVLVFIFAGLIKMK